MHGRPRTELGVTALAACLWGCSLLNPIPDLTGGSEDAGFGGSAAASSGGAGGTSSGGSSGSSGSGGSGGSSASGGGGGTAGSGASGGSTGGGGASGGSPGGGGSAGTCASSKAEVCADFDGNPWNAGFDSKFLQGGGTIEVDAADSVSSPASALALVPVVPAGNPFGAGALTYTLPAAFTSASLAFDMKLESDVGPQGTAVFLFQLAAPTTTHAGLQFIIGSGSQGLHETPGGFHPVGGKTFPKAWAHVVFTLNLGTNSSVTLSVDGAKWLDQEAITPPPLSAPYFAVGIVQVDGPTGAESRVRLDNVVLDLS